MKSVTDVYSILDFGWDGFSHWSLTAEEAVDLLQVWVRDIPERVSKLRNLMDFDAQSLAGDGFFSSDLPVIEKYLLTQGSLETSKKDGKDYLDAFSFEICLDAAAVVGQMCINSHSGLDWSLNTDVSSGPRFQSIGIVSAATQEHFPIPMMICEHVEETLKQRKTFLGGFKRPRKDVLIDIVKYVSFSPETSNA
ncbi:hypothetical protein [Halovulum sp. GXIMD14793]